MGVGTLLVVIGIISAILMADAGSFPWWYAILYIVPGLITLAAGLSDNRCMHIVNIVFMSICIGIGGILAIIMLTATVAIDYTIGAAGNKCSYNTQEACDRAVSIIRGNTAIVCINWILFLASLIISGMKHCCCARS